MLGITVTANGREFDKATIEKMLEEAEKSVSIPRQQDASSARPTDGFVERRNFGEYEGIAFFLNSNYDWKIVKDSANCLVLVPSRKIF